MDESVGSDTLQSELSLKAGQATNLTLLILAHQIQNKLLKLNQALDIALFKPKGELNMAVSPEVQKVYQDLSDATDAIADRIQRLIDRPGTGLSAEDKALFQAEVDRLTAMGKDPVAPISGT